MGMESFIRRCRVHLEHGLCLLEELNLGKPADRELITNSRIKGTNVTGL